MDYLSTPSTTDESENASRNSNGQSLSISSSNSSNSVSTRSRKKMEPRSWTWHYFLRNQDIPICIICSTQVKIYNSSTTELINHLSEHGIDEKSNLADRSRKRLRLDFSSESEIESEEENTREQTSSKIKKKVEKIHGKLMAFILSNNLPFNIVESAEFQDFIDSIKKNYYKLPCRQTVKNTILYQMSENLKMKLKLEFDAVEYGSITTDCWSSNSNLSYMGITFHYLDNSMHLTSRYLCLKYMEESHSAIYLKECLEKVLLSWNLRDKVYGVVTDSAANIKAALELFSGNIQRIPCAAHKLHLCVNDLFKIKNIKFKLDKERNREMAFIRDVDKDSCSRDLMIDEITQNQITSINAIKNELLNPLMSKCRRLVGSFKHSDSLTRILKEKQISLESPNKTKLIQDVPTRWNTSYDMMYSILINKDALVSLSLDRENSVIRQNMPTEIEFIILQDLCKILEPLKDLTEFLSGSKYITCSILHPAIYALTNYDLQSLNIYDENIRKLRDELLGIIKKRFNYVLNENTNSFFIMSSFLDFNYRKFNYIKDNNERLRILEKAKKLIVDFAMENLAENNETNNTMPILTNVVNHTSYLNRNNESNRQPRYQKSSFLNKLQDCNDLCDINNLAKFDIEKEIYEYLNLRIHLQNDNRNKYNSLEIFNSHTQHLPILRRMAKIIFSVTATSVPAESLFSYAGLVQNELRNRLEPSTLDMINFIKNNYF